MPLVLRLNDLLGGIAPKGMQMYETAESAWHRIATRLLDHPLERIGRRVFDNLSEKQWIEVLAAICKNNMGHAGRVPHLADPMRGVVQDDCEIFQTCELISVPSGGKLAVNPIKGGFECKWVP